MKAAPTRSRVPLEVEPLEGRNLPSTVSYVNALYANLLHRSGSVDEVAGWTAQLNNGVPPTQVAAAFTSSVEFQQELVLADYQVLLKRVPQPAEVQGWVNQLQNGVTEQQVRAAFEGTPEFFALQGNDPSAWLKAVYEAGLGRTPEAGDSAYWIGQLQNGVSRQAAALQIDTSPEAASHLVTLDYELLLGHAPDPSGLAYWTGQLGQGLKPSQFVAQLAGSTEFVNLQGGLGAASTPPTGSSSPSILSDGGTNPYDTVSNVGGFLDTTGIDLSGQAILDYSTPPPPPPDTTTYDPGITTPTDPGCDTTDTSGSDYSDPGFCF